MIDHIRCTRLGPPWGARLRPLISALLALALFAAPRAALAKDRTIAIYVEGAEAGAMRNALLVTVPAGTVVAETETFTAGLGQAGQKVPFGKGLDGEARDRAVTRVRGAMAAAGLDGALIARVIKGKNQRTVKLLFVTSSRSDAPREDEVVLGPKRSKEDTAKLRAFVDPAMASLRGEAPAEKSAPAPEKPAPAPAAAATAAPPPAPEAEAKEAKAPPEAGAPAGPESSSTRPRGEIGSSLAQVEVGAEAAGRHFVYADSAANSANLRSGDVFPAAMVTANAQMFPFADSRGFLRDLGVVAGYSRTLFLSSAVRGESNITTTESSYLVGVRARFRPTSDPGMIIGVSDGYASQAVDFASASSVTNAQLPAVNCTGNRLAVDGRVPFGRLSFGAAIGYRLIFDAGVLAKRFRNPSTGGIDAELGGAYALAPNWEVRAIVDYERYFYSFKPVPGDTYVAGGALDQFYGGRLAVAYIY